MNDLLLLQDTNGSNKLTHECRGVGYSEVGMQEALEAGKRLEFVPIDVVFCSQMDRARTTMSLALSLHSSKKTPVVEHCSPLEKPSFEGVNDKSPYDFVRGSSWTDTVFSATITDLLWYRSFRSMYRRRSMRETLVTCRSAVYLRWLMLFAIVLTWIGCV